MHQMGLVLWIDKNEFATSALEKIFEKQGLSIYTINSPQDIQYLIEDLKPEVIVMDVGTYLANEDRVNMFMAASEVMQNTPWISAGTRELSFPGAQMKGHIKKPLNIMTVANDIRKILGLLN
jgi:CheY-like chemotaxis protein